MKKIAKAKVSAVKKEEVMNTLLVIGILALVITGFLLAIPKSSFQLLLNY